jgi:hypothetical protein
MKKTLLVASALLVMAMDSAATQAQQPCGNRYQTSCAQQYRARYDANVQWPRSFIPPARQSVSSTYDAMVNNGWRRQNLLGDYHFNAETNELTEAGKLKVNWILSQAPPQRRNVFVQRARHEMETSERVTAVHQYAGSMSPGVGTVSVNDTHIVAEGHPASTVDSMFTGYETNRRAPVLPASTYGGGE